MRLAVLAAAHGPTNPFPPCLRAATPPLLHPCCAQAQSFPSSPPPLRVGASLPLVTPPVHGARAATRARVVAAHPRALQHLLRHRRPRSLVCAAVVPPGPRCRTASRAPTQQGGGAAVGQWTALVRAVRVPLRRPRPPRPTASARLQAAAAAAPKPALPSAPGIRRVVHQSGGVRGCACARLLVQEAGCAAAGAGAQEGCVCGGVGGRDFQGWPEGGGGRASGVAAQRRGSKPWRAGS